MIRVSNASSAWYLLKNYPTKCVTEPCALYKMSLREEMVGCFYIIPSLEIGNLFVTVITIWNNTLNSVPSICPKTS